jgi:hypothetical protein
VDACNSNQSALMDAYCRTRAVAECMLIMNFVQEAPDFIALSVLLLISI